MYSSHSCVKRGGLIFLYRRNLQTMGGRGDLGGESCQGRMVKVWWGWGEVFRKFLVGWTCPRTAQLEREARRLSGGADGFAALPYAVSSKNLQYFHFTTPLESRRLGGEKYSSYFTSVLSLGGRGKDTSMSARLKTPTLVTRDGLSFQLLFVANS